MIQGMSPKQLKKMIFIENLVIGFFATIFGSIVGIGFSQLILWISNVLMHLNLGFYLPVIPFLITVAAFAVLFLVISFFIQFRLPKANLQELLKAGEMGKGTISSSKIKVALAVLLIGAGYGIALSVKGQAVIVATLPVMFLVILGTKFLFDQLSVSVIEKLKSKPKLFWKKTNMVVFSDLAFRMKDNARSFFLVSIISTVAFAAIGTLYGVNNLLFSTLDQLPFEYSLSDTDSAEGQTAKQELTDELKNKGIQFDEVNYVLYTSADNVLVMKESSYNELAKVAEEPEITTSGTGVNLHSEIAAGHNREIKNIKLANNQDIPINKTVQTKLLSTGSGLVVVPDTVDLNGLQASNQTIWNPTDTSKEQLVEIGKKMQEKNPACRRFK